MTDTELALQEVNSKIQNLSAIVVGPQGDNGLRSRVEKLTQNIEALADTFRDHWYNKRVEECIGRKLMAEHKEEHSMMNTLSINEKKLALDAEKAARDSRTTLIVAVVGAAAGIGAALISLLKV